MLIKIKLLLIYKLCHLVYKHAQNINPVSFPLYICAPLIRAAPVQWSVIQK